MVANGKAMHEIMKASQEEARMTWSLALRSQELGEEMKRDSVAMKTVSAPSRVVYGWLLTHQDRSPS
jgi:hypothetical protein